MRSALRLVPGVDCTHVSIPAGTVTVGCAEGCDHGALLAALERKGYGGEIRAEPVSAP